MDGFVEWIAGFILTWLLTQAKNAVQVAEAQAKTDQERGVINDANVKAYEAAKSRVEARQAALDLINRNRKST